MEAIVQASRVLFLKGVRSLKYDIHYNMVIQPLLLPSWAIVVSLGCLASRNKKADRLPCRATTLLEQEVSKTALQKRDGLQFFSGECWEMSSLRVSSSFACNWCSKDFDPRIRPRNWGLQNSHHSGSRGATSPPQKSTPDKKVLLQRRPSLHRGSAGCRSAGAPSTQQRSCCPGC